VYEMRGGAVLVVSAGGGEGGADVFVYWGAGIGGKTKGADRSSTVCPS